MKPFDLPPLPPQDIGLEGLVPLIGRANATLSRYDGLLESLINPQILLAPLAMKEAEFSSRIEGTMATANEVYQREAGRVFGPERDADIVEVLNYRRTLGLASEQIEAGSISLHLIRQMHGILMQGVRGDQFKSGAFRRTQNWIGPKGCAIEEAKYVPPPPERLADHLEQLEAYLTGSDTRPDPIVRAALIHAQFELIHPFDDGNGRIGRLLIPLYLAKVGSLVEPSFYISAYFEEHRDEYHHRLGAISQAGDWHGWVSFFLTATIEQARRNSDLVRKIVRLYEEKKGEFLNLLKSDQAIPLLDLIFGSPVFCAPEVHRRLGINRARAAQYLRTLVKHKMLEEIRSASGRKGALLSFEQLWEITDQQ